jgi:stress response protein SCP2
MAAPVAAQESVYFAQLCSRSGALRHTGDEREGDEDLGDGDDEIIVIDLNKVPRDVVALVCIATVATEGRTFADVKTSKMRLVDWKTGTERCRYYPGSVGAHTALFMCRLARSGGGWTMQTIGGTDHTARDWGTLVPEIKTYCADLVPGFKDAALKYPDERIAIMRKGGHVRLRDYCGTFPPPVVTLGLAWDVTDGVNIDLDASVIMLDEGLQLLDIVFFGQLQSKDGAIVHGGDEREGDEKGDDEKIYFHLSQVHPAARYLCIVVNSYSGQELDDVSMASCHLFCTEAHSIA